MTDAQHQYVQRDLAALQAAEKKLKDSLDRVHDARLKVDAALIAAADAEKSAQHAQVRFLESVDASRRVDPNGCRNY
jgi:hypothetical protein